MDFRDSKSRLILIVVALGIALVAGLLSARRAARLTPVEALRYE
jgi:ABC-type antimicrobial peptide transport system permease subunit